MRRTVCFAIIALLCLPISTLSAQTQEKKARKAPNLSLNIGRPVYKQEKKAWFSIGLMAKVYRLQGAGINLLSSTARTKSNGLQLSGFANVSGTGMRGLQLSGIANINGGDARGLPAAGLLNVAKRNGCGLLAAGGINLAEDSANGLAIGGLLNIMGKASNGMAIGGLANIAGENTAGAALSGLLNVSGKDVRGLQATALLNIAGREAAGAQAAALGNVSVRLDGLQAAGAANIVAEDMNGVQVGAANYARRMKGLQIGVANIAGDTVRGVQAGIVNYSRDTTGVKLGIVNITPRTRVQMMVYGGNAAKFNVAARFLNRWSYTILGIGAPWLKMDDPFSLSASYRAGLHFSPARGLRLSGDLGYSHIEVPGDAVPGLPERMYSLQARVNVEYQAARRLGLFVSGGYATTRRYGRGGEYEGKPVIEFGLLLF